MKKRTYTPFRPIDKKTRLKINNKPKTPTIFMYQKGFVKDKIALRILKKNQVFKTLISSNKKSWKSITDQKDKSDDKIAEIWDIIRDFGGQSPDKAQYQREECLTKIVRNYFKKLGYKIEEQPKLKDNTPDLLITKEDENFLYSCYIELKAYFGRTIVGEPEVAQILKYSTLGNEQPDLMKSTHKQVKSKSILITTGELIPFEENSFFNGELLKNKSDESKIRFIKKQYKKHLHELGWPHNMEASDTRNIYRFAHKKLKKYSLALQSDYSSTVIQLTTPIPLYKLIENDDNYDVILIPAGIFSQILQNCGLTHEQSKFNQIQKTWLERLIFDKSILTV